MKYTVYCKLDENGHWQGGLLGYIESVHKSKRGAREWIWQEAVKRKAPLWTFTVKRSDGVWYTYDEDNDRLVEIEPPFKAL